MAIFGKKKTEEGKEETTKKVVTKKTSTKTVKAEKPVKEKVAKAKTEVTEVKAKKADEKVTAVKSDYSYRITEKATRLADKNVYVLNVPKNSNKTELKKDIQAKYKVTVLGINIVNSPKKAKNYRGRPGMRGGGKKAYITLKAGESIVL